MGFFEGLFESTLEGASRGLIIGLILFGISAVLGIFKKKKKNPDDNEEV